MVESSDTTENLQPVLVYGNGRVNILKFSVREVFILSHSEVTCVYVKDCVSFRTLGLGHMIHVHVL